MPVDSTPATLYRCRRCGTAFDYSLDITEAPKRFCEECGSKQWENNTVHVTPKQAFRVRKETGMWMRNDPITTSLDRKLMEIWKMPVGEAQDKAERDLLIRLEEIYGKDIFDLEEAL
tara:strand:+ start:46131 stop:46481 length:351 start_codon:yes stop_codon:yes gene_type:complete